MGKYLPILRIACTADVGPTPAQVDPRARTQQTDLVSSGLGLVVTQLTARSARLASSAVLKSTEIATRKCALLMMIELPLLLFCPSTHDRRLEVRPHFFDQR